MKNFWQDFETGDQSLTTLQNKFRKTPFYQSKFGDVI